MFPDELEEARNAELEELRKALMAIRRKRKDDRLDIMIRMVEEAGKVPTASLTRVMLTRAVEEGLKALASGR